MNAIQCRKAISVSIGCLCAMMLFLFSTVTFAQNDVGTIVGFITDQSGAVVPNAKITVTNEGTGETRAVTSDSQGRYTVPNLSPAIYTMTAEASGFQKFVSIHNTLASNTTIDIDAKLTVGQTTQTIQVTATALVLQTQSGAVQSMVTSEQVQKQELNGRNPIYMAQLLPGVNSTATLGDFNYSFNSGDTFRINGARTQDTQYTLDGAPAVRTRNDGEIIAGANVDSVQEIQVLTANYAPEYGGASGAQVRIVTKSGTTDFHGDLYEYLRNSAMNANTWTRNLNPATRFPSPFRYNNFGFAIGGPMWIPKVPFMESWRNKFFFFVNEDWIRYRFTDTQTQAVPTNLMRQGNFSELLNPNPWYPTGTQIFDPTTCPSVGASTCVAYPNNVIPQAQWSHNGMAIIGSYPAPTAGFLQGTANWAASAPHPINQRKGQINADFLITPNQHLEYRRADNSYNESAPFNQNNPLVPLLWQRPNQTNAVGWTWAISPTMINEARFSVSIDDVYIGINPAGAGYDRGSFGIDFPYILPGGKAAENKIPTVSVPTFLSLSGGPYPSHSSGIIYAGSDSFTKVFGNHTFKAGFFFDYSGENDNDQINVDTVANGASNQNGSFTFTDGRTGLGATSGVGLANLALGLADSYTEIGPRAYTVWRGTRLEYFAQDHWQVTPKFHMDYGLRITTTIPPHALWANATYFDPPSYNPGNAPAIDSAGNVILGTGDAYNGIVIPGFSSFPSTATQNNRVPAANPANNACAGQPCTGLFAPHLPKGYVNTTTTVQPRLGIAYQVAPTTVVRAGGGRFVTNKGIIDNIFPGGNSPFQPTVTVNNVSVDNPGAALNPSVEAPIIITTMNRNLTPPTRWNWNLTVEQEVTPLHSIFQIGYVGARGVHNWNVLDINQAAAGALLANPGTNINSLRPSRGFGFIQQAQSGVSSTYHALQVSWNSHFSDGSTLGIAYTYSKSMDNSSNYRDIVPDSYNLSNLWAPSEYDIRNVLIVNYLYVLPFFRGQQGVLGKTLGGWQLSGSAQFQSGQPCGVGDNNDHAGVGEIGSFGCGTMGQFWVINGTARHIGGFAGPNGTGSKWFATTNGTGNPVFTPPTPGTFNLQHGVRNNIYGPGLQNWNLALMKTFPIYKEHTFEFRAEAYNFINHPNLAAIGSSGGLNLTPTNSQFGEVTGKSTTNPRTLQVGAHYRF